VVCWLDRNALAQPPGSIAARPSIEPGKASLANRIRSNEFRHLSSARKLSATARVISGSIAALRMKTVSATSEQVIRAYDACRFRSKKGKIPASDFQQAKQGPRPPVLCWWRFRPVISAREIPTPTLRHQRSGATSAGGSVRHTLRHTRPSRFQFPQY